MEIINKIDSVEETPFRVGEVYYSDGEFYLIVFDNSRSGYKGTYRLVSLSDGLVDGAIYESLVDLKDDNSDFLLVKSKLIVE